MRATGMKRVGDVPIRMSIKTMTDLDPCLAGCDSALAEAALLLAILSASGSDETALAPVRQSIAKLRREVDRLRGFKVIPARREADPGWMSFGEAHSPWQPGEPPIAEVG